MVLGSHRLTLPSNNEYSVPQLRMMLREVQAILGRRVGPDVYPLELTAPTSDVAVSGAVNPADFHTWGPKLLLFAGANQIDDSPGKETTKRVDRVTASHSGCRRITKSRFRFPDLGRLMFQARRMQQPRCSEFAAGASVHELARWKVLLLRHSKMSCQ